MAGGCEVLCLFIFKDFDCNVRMAKIYLKFTLLLLCNTIFCER